MFNKSLILPVLKDRVMLGDNAGLPDKNITVNIKYDCPIIYAVDDQDVNTALAMLNHAIDVAFKSYEDEYDFWEPQCILKPNGEIGAQIQMKRKPESQEESE